MCNDKLHLQWKRIVRLFVSQGQKRVTFLLAPVCMVLGYLILHLVRKVALEPG